MAPEYARLVAIGERLKNIERALVKLHELHAETYCLKLCSRQIGEIERTLIVERNDLRAELSR